jgi:hypothetical protein
VAQRLASELKGSNSARESQVVTKRASSEGVVRRLAFVRERVLANFGVV